MTKNNQIYTNEKSKPISQNQILCFIGIVAVPMALSWLFSLLITLAKELSLRSFSPEAQFFTQLFGMIVYAFVIGAISLFFFRNTRFKYIHQLIYLVLNVVLFILLFKGVPIILSTNNLENQVVLFGVTTGFYLFDIVFGAKINQNKNS